MGHTHSRESRLRKGARTRLVYFLWYIPLRTVREYPLLLPDCREGAKLEEAMWEGRWRKVIKRETLDSLK